MHAASCRSVHAMLFVTQHHALHVVLPAVYMSSSGSGLRSDNWGDIACVCSCLLWLAVVSHVDSLLLFENETEDVTLVKQQH